VFVLPDCEIVLPIGGPAGDVPRRHSHTASNAAVSIPATIKGHFEFGWCIVLQSRYTNDRRPAKLKETR
jgi:hypothetical protein